MPKCALTAAQPRRRVAAVSTCRAKFRASPRAPEDWRTPRRCAFAGRWVPFAVVLDSTVSRFGERALQHVGQGGHGDGFFKQVGDPGGVQVFAV